MGNRVNLNINQKRKLSWFYTDGNCCLCHSFIGFFENNGFIGEFAHIIDLKKATSRYEKNKKIEELNNIENIMVLCPTCHTKIDKESNEYTTLYLKEIKQQYEDNIKMSREYSNPKYLEVFNDIYTTLKDKYKLISNRKTLSPITIAEKINKNDLNEISEIITEGLSMESCFVDYLDTLSSAERTELRKIIIEIYLEEVKKENSSSTDKFHNMVKSIIGTNMGNYLYAITILSYYFEECDVFEA